MHIVVFTNKFATLNSEISLRTSWEYLIKKIKASSLSDHFPITFSLAEELIMRRKLMSVALVLLYMHIRVCKFYWWVESLWLLLHKFWSHLGIFGVKYHNEKSHFQTFEHVVLSCIHYRDGYTKWLWRSADLESSNPWWWSSNKLWS